MQLGAMLSTTRSPAREENGMNENAITEGTTNVFADLGFTDASERQTKTRLAYILNDIIKGRKLRLRLQCSCKSPSLKFPP